MKILLVTSHFFPETFKANDMAFELVRRGHEVTVLAPIPDYPQGKFHDGYGLFKKRVEIVKGVKVIRTLIIPRRDGSALWLGLNYLTHTFFSSLRALRLALQKKFDVILVHETSPVIIGIPAVLVKKIQKIPLHFWVLDLWPESLSAAGGIHNKKILNLFARMTGWMYANSERVLISSKGFRKSINALGDFDSKLEYFPNWVDEEEVKAEDKDYFNFPKGLNVVFTGNIGDAQDMPNLLQAARELKDQPINFILVGDGRKRPWVEDFVRKNDLRNVYLTGGFPRNVMPWFYERADVLFLALKDEPIFALTAPAKLQAYMASGKPVVAMINGEGAELIKEADCGWSVPAGDSASLASLLLQVAEADAAELSEKGENGRDFAETHFKFLKCIDHLEEGLNSIKL